MRAARSIRARAAIRRRPASRVLAAGGFTAEAALAALLGGELPPEDPATCARVRARRDDHRDRRTRAGGRAGGRVRGARGRQQRPLPRAAAQRARPRGPRLWRAPTCRHSIREAPASARPRMSSSSSSRRAPPTAARALTHYVLRGCVEDVTARSPSGTSRPTRPLVAMRAVRPPELTKQTRRSTARGAVARARGAGAGRCPARKAARTRARDSVRATAACRPGRVPHGDKDDEGPPRCRCRRERSATRGCAAGSGWASGLAYGQLVGLRGAPSGRLIGPKLRVGLRLDADWSLFASFQYAGASAPGGLSGLRFAGTVDPTWHVTRHLSLALGFGFGGIVEGVHRADPTPTRCPERSRPRTRSPTRARRWRAAAASARRVWRAPSGRTCSGRARRPASASRSIGQWTGCVDDTGRVEPDTGKAIVRRQWWPHTGAVGTWGSRGAEARRAG